MQMQKYFTLPLKPSVLMEGKEHPSCTLKDSIGQRIHLILITNLNECRYDPAFGNIMWELDFENIPNITVWKDNIAKAIKEAINNYETRLVNIKATVDVTEEEIRDKENHSLKRIKKRVDIKVHASIKKTNEPFYFTETLYISPLWID